MFSFLPPPRHRPILVMEPDGRLTSHCTHRHPCWLVRLHCTSLLWRQMRLRRRIRQKPDQQEYRAT